ncbi:hypothetical protein [Solitalea canadensis]|uniref:Uncharacterized protein n=1 Tax=Solitalea canadensis (strain ATCC 29591 / DSM 3403 / JCM 21819 / LMG 8368 / NBRC 15130 / NCIMB 12057 / USAM 9D) TaxID=929556 RepID=H8KQ62_SOLCM|nr:hypothetical protein [Solitalea canadensis]AFD06230.1 hypothetical protein Solca_1124 [Solitalea canadensis DSM 3403]
MKKAIPYSLHLILLLLLIILCYFTQRENSTQLISLFIASFAAYFAILRFYNDEDNYKINLWSGFILRVAVIFALPNLTNDFYRFVWDGQLLTLGFDPFAHRPASYLAAGVQLQGITPELYSKLNSPNYYSIYPPFCQSIFGIACSIFPNDIYKSVLVMKATILLFELGTLGMIASLLKQFKLPRNRIAIYALNPLCIVEFCGNLHFEAGMIFFTLLVIYLLTINRTLIASLFMAMAFCIKLLPALFIPLLLRPFGFRKSFDIAFLGLVAAVIFSLPFVYNIDQLRHIVETFHLYYEKLTFNASFFYLIKAIQTKITGSINLLLIGKIIGGIFIAAMFYLTFFTSKKREMLPTRMMWALFAFLLLSPAVFPWYCIALLALSLFTNYRFPLIWSCLIPLTYIAYTTTPFKENLWITGIEYTLLAAYLLFELIGKKNFIDAPLKTNPPITAAEVH